MTALCGGGPSGSRPGFDGGVYYGAAGISALLKAFFPPPVADAIAAIVSADALDLTTFCTSDPPPLPSPTAEDFVALLNPGDFAEYDRVRKLFMQLWEHIFWHQACECKTVATPPLETIPTVGPGSQNPGLPTGEYKACYESTAGYQATGVSSGNTKLDLTTVWLPVSPDRRTFSIDFGLGPISVSAVRVPPGVTQYWFRTQNHGAVSPAPSNSFDATVTFWDTNGTVVESHQFLTSQATVITLQDSGFLVPATAAYVGIPAENTFDTAVAGKQMSWEVDFQFRCAGSALETPCCPPDPKLELKIDQLMELVINLNRSTGVQPPTGWHDGARHSALRGAGSFLIDPRAMAIRWEVTTPPAGVKVDPGNPDFYWDMGFWSPYALTSPLRGGRLVFLHQTVTLPEFTDQVGYTLKNGTVTDAIELLPTTS